MEIADTYYSKDEYVETASIPSYSPWGFQVTRR